MVLKPVKITYIKILHFISGKGLSGAKTMFLAYQKVFSYLGWQSIPIVRSNALLGDILSTTAVYFNYNRIIPLIFQRAAIRRAKSITAVEKPDFIVLHKGIDARFWSIACPSVCSVLIVHGFSTKYLKYAKRLIAVSPAVLEYLEKMGYKATLISNFLDQSISYHHIKQNNVVKIGSFGFFRRTKGFTDLIKALAIVEKKYPSLNFSAHLWGGGQLKYIYHIMCLVYNVKNFFIHPWTLEAKDIMKELDIAIVPSRSETFGMVVIEAIASGAWVISTNTLGAANIINKCGGTIVPCNSPNELADAICNVASKIHNYTQKRYEARNNVNKFYSIERAAKDIFHVFNGFLKIKK